MDDKKQFKSLFTESDEEPVPPPNSITWNTWLKQNAMNLLSIAIGLIIIFSRESWLNAKTEVKLPIGLQFLYNGLNMKESMIKK